MRGSLLSPVLLLCLISGAASEARPAASEPARKTITIHSKKYAFEPSEITLKKGEPVRVVLLSADTPHGLAVPGIGLHLDAAKDRPAEAVVTPEATGDFAGKCSRFCGSGHRDMRFTVHVAE